MHSTSRPNGHRCSADRRFGKFWVMLAAAVAFSLAVASCGSNGLNVPAGVGSLRYVGTISYHGDGGTVSFRYSVTRPHRLPLPSPLPSSILRLGTCHGGYGGRTGPMRPDYAYGVIAISWHGPSNTQLSLPVATDILPADGIAIDTAYEIHGHWNCTEYRDPSLSVSGRGTMTVPFLVGFGSLSASALEVMLGQVDASNTGPSLTENQPTVTGPNAASCSGGEDSSPYRLGFFASPPYSEDGLACSAA